MPLPRALALGFARRGATSWGGSPAAAEPARPAHPAPKRPRRSTASAASCLGRPAARSRCGSRNTRCVRTVVATASACSRNVASDRRSGRSDLRHHLALAHRQHCAPMSTEANASSASRGLSIPAGARWSARRLVEPGCTLHRRVAPARWSRRCRGLHSRPSADTRRRSPASRHGTAARRASGSSIVSTEHEFSGFCFVPLPQAGAHHGRQRSRRRHPATTTLPRAITARTYRADPRLLSGLANRFAVGRPRRPPWC
jgi:hypothetical protein